MSAVLPRQPAPAAATGPRRAATRLAWVSWAFSVFSAARTLAYLPNLVSIWQSERSDQHSITTWLILAASNAATALYLQEANDGRRCRVVWISWANAAQCLMTVAFIAWFRF